MKLYKLLLFAAVALLASCAKEPLNQIIPNVDGTYADDSSVSKGWVRIKLTEDAQPLTAGVFTRGAAQSGNADLDRLAADLGATEIRKVFTLNKRFEKRHREYGLHLWYDVKFDENITVTRAQNDFSSLPQIEIAEPIYKAVAVDGADYIMPARDGFTLGARAAVKASGSTEAYFNDSELPMQWHYNNTGAVQGSVVGADIGLFEAWEKFGAGKSSVIVAVMDNAIQYDHPDLADNIWINKGEIAGNGIDDDENGFIDDVHGWDFFSKVSFDRPGSHGTHVAGTVAAVNNNNFGVCGVAGGTGVGDGVRLMTNAIYDFEGVGETDPNAYVYAADNGAIISQNSWNIPGMNRPVLPKALSLAFDYFINNAGVDENGNQVGLMKGGVIIFAAGNQATGLVGVPAEDPRLISVTAMLPNYVMTSYSNYGVDADIFAPGGSGIMDRDFPPEVGGGVYSTDINDGYSYKAGTSMACPHVSGVAGIAVSHFGGPGFTNKMLKDMLLRSVVSVSDYQKSAFIAAGLGTGLLKAGMLDITNPAQKPNKPTDLTVKAGDEEQLLVDITIPADAAGRYVTVLKLSYVKKTEIAQPEAWKKVVINNNLKVGAVKTHKILLLNDATDYVVRVIAVDSFGNESDFTEAEGRTIDHINRYPTHKKSIEPISFPIQGFFSVNYDLNEYFDDPDLPNDKLTFTATSMDPSIVVVSVDDKGVLTVEGVKKGNISISIVATDLAGAKMSKGVYVKVTAVPTGIVSSKKNFEALSLPQTVNGRKEFEKTYTLADYFEESKGAKINYSAVGADESIVVCSVNNSAGTMTVKAVKEGNVTINVQASNVAGSKITQAIVVAVTEAPSGADKEDNALSVYPSIVTNVANVNVKGVGTTTAQMRIYDAASRLVRSSNVDIQSDVFSISDVATLTQGVYSVVITVGGKEYKNSFVKK